MIAPTPTPLTRRRFLQLAGSAALALPSVLQAKSTAQPSIGLSIYGAKSLEEGLSLSKAIGYENVALYLGPSPTSPLALSRPGRRELRQRLDALGLTISGMSMHALPLGSGDSDHAKNLEAIKQGAQFAHDVFPEAPPPLEAQSNGKTEDWEPTKDKLAERLNDWATTATAAGIGIGLKAHANNAVDTPEKLLWLLKRMTTPAIRVNYDYSHFEFTSGTLAETLQELLPYTTFIQVKDAEMLKGKRHYLLPGEGDINYAEYFGILRRAGWTGPVVVEVSAHVVARPHFDFEACARSSFKAVEAGRRAAY